MFVLLKNMIGIEKTWKFTFILKPLKQSQRQIVNIHQQANKICVWCPVSPVTLRCEFTSELYRTHTSRLSWISSAIATYSWFYSAVNTNLSNNLSEVKAGYTGNKNSSYKPVINATVTSIYIFAQIALCNFYCQSKPSFILFTNSIYWLHLCHYTYN